MSSVVPFLRVRDAEASARWWASLRDPDGSKVRVGTPLAG